jgi:hypothetical protein
MWTATTAILSLENDATMRKHESRIAADSVAKGSLRSWCSETAKERMGFGIGTLAPFRQWPCKRLSGKALEPTRLSWLAGSLTIMLNNAPVLKGGAFGCEAAVPGRIL